MFWGHGQRSPWLQSSLPPEPRAQEGLALAPMTSSSRPTSWHMVGAPWAFASVQFNPQNRSSQLFFRFPLIWCAHAYSVPYGAEGGRCCGQKAHFILVSALRVPPSNGRAWPSLKMLQDHGKCHRWALWLTCPCTRTHPGHSGRRGALSLGWGGCGMRRYCSWLPTEGPTFPSSSLKIL